MRGGIILAVLSVVGSLVLSASDQIVAAPRKPQGVEPKKDLEVALPTELPAGPLHIIVSIGKQRAELYSNGEPIVSIPVSTGTAEHPTPTGVFSILQKRTWHESNIYSAAPMPFMQRITWSGVAMHEGVLPGYPASHGCIRMPRNFATWLFGITDLGVRVIVANDDPKIEDISHPLLFFASKTVSGPGVERTSQESGSIYRTNASISMPRKFASIDADAGNVQDAARINTIAVFISKKEGRLYVRRNFAPLFDAPVVFENRQRPIGTHVFTAMDVKNGGPEMRWSAVSMKSDDSSDELHDRYSINARWVDGRMIRTASFSRERWTALSASKVLDRIYIPQEAVDRISQYLTPGSSLIVSDEGLNKETRKHTEFVVLTSPPAAFLNPQTAEKDWRRAQRQEAVTPAQPATTQRARPDATLRPDEGRPVTRPTTMKPVALQSSQDAKPDIAPPQRPTTVAPAVAQSPQPAKPEAAPRAEKPRVAPRPAAAQPAATPLPQPAKAEAAQHLEERHSVARPSDVEPAMPKSSRRARSNAADREDGRRSVNRSADEDAAAPRLRRANFDSAPRVDERRSIPRVESGGRQIELVPP